MMGQDSKIEWCHHTFNHVRGCTKVSAGCANCYAETLSHRNPGTLGVWGPNGTRVVASESMWKEPLKWNKKAGEERAAWERAVMSARSEYDAVGPYERPRVFCASLADVFEDWKGPMVDAKGETLFSTGGHPHWQPAATVNLRAYPGFDASDELFRTKMDDMRRRLFDLIDETPHLDWLLLTKRPENVSGMTSWLTTGWPVNVWLGTSVENQQAADERIPHLLRIPAAVRFLSMEPLLGPVDLMRIPVPTFQGVRFDSLLKHGKGAWGTGARVDWVIVGGESGHGARPMHPDWARSIRDQCQEAGVAFHFKQWGEHLPNDHMTDEERIIANNAGKQWTTLNDGISLGTYRLGKKEAGRLLDGRTWDEVPCPDAFS